MLAALRARVRDLEDRGERVPEGLLEATKDFQEDLADVCAQAAELGARLSVAKRDTDPCTARGRR